MKHFGFVIVTTVAVGAVVIAAVGVSKSVYDAVKREKEHGRT